MTHLSSRRKPTNRTSHNTLIVLTLPSNLQLRPARRMVPSPSRDTIVKPEADSNLSIMCTGNPPTQTSTYSGTVNTTSEQNLVLLTPHP